MIRDRAHKLGLNIRFKRCNFKLVRFWDNRQGTLSQSRRETIAGTKDVRFFRCSACYSFVPRQV